MDNDVINISINVKEISNGFVINTYSVDPTNYTPPEEYYVPTVDILVRKIQDILS